MKTLLFRLAPFNPVLGEGNSPENEAVMINLSVVLA